MKRTPFLLAIVVALAASACTSTTSSTPGPTETEGGPGPNAATAWPIPTPGPSVAGPKVATFGGAISLERGSGWARYGAVSPYDLVVDAAGVMWLAAEQGAFALDLRTGKLAQLSVDTDVYRSVALAADGTVWFGSPTHLAHFDGTWHDYFTVDGLPNSHVIATAAAPDGDLWISTRNAGVARLHAGSWTSWEHKDGLAQDYMGRLLFGPDGSLWAGTGDEYPTGLSRFDGAKWTTYTTADGMPAAAIAPLGVAPDGAVWFGTLGKGGISRFDGKTWTHFRKSDGHAADNAQAMAAGPDGTLWFASSDGILSYAGGKWAVQTPQAGTLPVRNVTRMAFDIGGTLWLACGTEGLVSFQK